MRGAMFVGDPSWTSGQRGAIPEVSLRLPASQHQFFDLGQMVEVIRLATLATVAREQPDNF